MDSNNPIADALDWYWNWAEGDLGAPSNYMAMVNAISLGRSAGGSRSSTEMDEGRLAMATKARLIARALDRLDAPQRRVLYAAFGPHARELPILGKAAPVAPLTATAQAAHSASRTARPLEEWLVRLTHRASERLGAHVEEDRAIAHAIANEANAALSRATRAFVEALSGKSEPEGKASRRAA